jgi:hypothetical protein
MEELIMNLEIKYLLFKNINGTIIPDKSDRYQVIVLEDGIEPDTPEGLNVIKEMVSIAIDEPKTNIKVLSGRVI